MAPGVAQLIAAQEAAFNNIKQICGNYKKDGAARKTGEYLEKRMAALKQHWNEFHNNHQHLTAFEDQEIPYFIDDVFGKTKKLYEDTISDIQRLKESTSEPGKSSTAFQDIKFSVPVPGRSQDADDSSNTRQRELLRQQFCNFRAFDHVVEKINVQSIVEQWELEDKLKTLKIKWEQIEKVHWELDYIMEDIDEAYQEKYSATENIYEGLKKKINQRIWNSTHYDKATPRMEIPDFYGNHNNWLSSKDLFVESVHNNPLLSKSQKMQHLKSKLKGEAEKLVQHLSISTDNYLSCWEIICHRYDNQRLLFTSYANALFNQQTIQQATAKTIKKHHDIILECLNGFTNIGLDTSTWDPIIVHLLVQKLDSSTYNEYIKDLKSPRELPNLEEYIKFLESKFMALETIQSGPNKTSTPQDKQPHLNKQRFYYSSRPMNYRKEIAAKTFVTTSTPRVCPLCKSELHVLLQCDKFLNMNAQEKRDTVMKLQLCKNCLYSHGEKKCTSFKKCKLCYRPHHTLLHEAENLEQRSTTANRHGSQAPSTSKAVNNVTSRDQEVLLTTVLLKVKTADGDYINLRALLDQGSQVSLISEDAAQRLRLPRRKMKAVISGVGTRSGNCKGYIELDCKSIHSDYTFTIETLIIKKLMNNLPNSSFKVDEWRIIENIKLADPHFNVPGPIDILLGADVYSDLILEGVLKEGSGFPVAQQTKLGWILCGGIKTFNCFATLHEDLTRFWETEEIDSKNEVTESDFCEEHFTTTTTRTPDGRYKVKMPIQPELEDKLGDTRSQAVAQFLQLERRMKNNPRFAAQYHQFIQEYRDMGHMLPAANTDGTRVYLPHHGVLKEDSITTKLRVVFNASQKTSTNLSLNDVMYTGPNLQKDMMSLLVNWRVYRYVFTADIEKMYRFIWLSEDQHKLQTIIWRSDAREPLQEWQLCTVTYGMKAAPYLAMRTLHQLAQDEREDYPEAARVLQNYFYMDDLIYGQDDKESAMALITQLRNLLKKGGFNLRKWNSNEPAILNELPDEQKCLKNIVEFGSTSTSTEINTKTLGIRWNPIKDIFIFNWTISTPKQQTKRTLLSEISKFYDPLGWLSPVIVGAKLLFQCVWRSNTDWDEKLQPEIEKQWNKLRQELPKINELTLPIWVQCNNNIMELHAFCDASEKAYACVMYSRAQKENGDYVTSLIAAKTKVAPLKKKTTLPRLELCGAVLLAKLVEKLRDTLKDKSLQVHCWSDSKVTLAWIQSDKNKWVRYVANRVVEIRKSVAPEKWSYVKTSENPADCATRGLSPSQLQSCKLWWEGPHWLRSSELKSREENGYKTDVELRVTYCVTTVDAKNAVIFYLLERYSNLNKITRILALLLRLRSSFCTQSKTKFKALGYKKKNDTQTCTLTPLSESELDETMKHIIKHTQLREFAEDIQHLKKYSTVSTKSSLLKLNPFLDEDGILRVKGRLNFSLLPKEAKNPIILPFDARLTELLIHQAHQETLHGGARLTLAHLRNQYWVMGGNRRIKKQLRHCVRCHRYKHHKNNQIMADLPKERVTPSRPFTNTGVDFTGHVDVKINKGRGVKTCKAYIAIFICMVTKAVHLELVSDLSTQTFLAAFKRMCSRRGTPRHVFSDNGTNFVGAAKQLDHDFQHNQTFEVSEFHNEMSKLRVQWHFNAPLWPTAGGLWEAAVKSMKYHLKRVLGEQKLTFEQFTTLLTQIEACLNSRPLGPLTEDIEDLEYITPGHFLVGGPLLAPPQREEEDFNQNDLRNRWKLIDQMNLHFWKRWSTEYIHQLQIRSKWRQPSKNIEEGDLVLVKDECLPPGKWAMGKVSEVHPGADGYVRVATIKTKKGLIKHPITKLAPLPSLDSEVAKTCSNNIKSTDKENGDLTSTKKSIRKPRFNVYNLLLLLLLAITGLAKSATIENAHITSFKNDNPMYFDEAGRLQLVHDEWTLLVYLNITSYWKMTSQMNEYISDIEKICMSASHVPCNAIVKQLKHEYDHLQEHNSLLLSQHLTRNKRGYFNGIGTLSRTLFGTLDEEFATKYEKDIQTMKSNEDYLLQLLKNQTSIVEAQNNVIKKSESLLESQFQSVQTYLNQTYSSYTRIETRVQTLFAINDVNTAAITASLIMNNLQRIQEILLNTISDIYKGHLDVHILSTSQLIEQLSLLSGKLPKGITLPLQDIKRDIRSIYKLLYVKARITSYNLLLEVHIPLLSDDEYTIYKVIPIPFITQERLKIIYPQSSYIAMNLAKNTYISIDDTDIQQCTKYEEDTYICAARQPVYSLHAKDAPCEAKVFSQQRLLSCNSNDVSCEDRWIKLHRQNLWLFTACDKQLLRVVCGDQITSMAIYGSGIITLRPKCVVQKKDATIFAHSNYGSSINMNVDSAEATIDSPINSLPKLNWNNSELNFTTLQSPNSLAEIIKIGEAIQRQKKDETLPTDNISNHDIYHYLMSSVLFGGAFAAAIYCICKRKCWRTESRRYTTTTGAGQQVLVETGMELQDLRNSKPAEPARSEDKRHSSFNFD